MTGDELVQKILSGERDFSRIKLPDETKLDSLNGYAQMNDYLKGQRNPLFFNEADCVGIHARSLFAYYAKLERANLNGAHLERAYLGLAKLLETHLERAHLERTNLLGAILTGAYLKRASLERASLEGAYLIGVTGLDSTKGLGYAIFENTTVTPKEKAIIEAARAQINLFNMILEN